MSSVDPPGRSPPGVGPLSWINAERLAPGHLISLSGIVDLAEMGVPDGLAGIVDPISACPLIQSGPGRVVLTTVSHLNDFLFDLTLKDASGHVETLEASGYHRFYDEARGWAEAQSLHAGEKLRGNSGDLTVVGLEREAGTQRVYNMTVEADHVYFVGDLSALVHNTCSDEGMRGLLNELRAKRDELTAKSINEIVRGAQYGQDTEKLVEEIDAVEKTISDIEAILGINP